MGELAIADPKPATEQCSKHKDDLAPAGVDPHQADEGDGQHAAQHARPIPAVIDEQLQGVLRRDQITLGAQKKGALAPFFVALGGRIQPRPSWERIPWPVRSSVERPITKPIMAKRPFQVSEKLVNPTCCQ